MPVWGVAVMADSSAGRPVGGFGSVRPRRGSRPMSPASGHGLWSGVRSRATQFMARPGIRHLVVALGRFNERLGSQFAGSLTYLSFLALIPILMVAFSVAGFVLASRPAVLTDLQTQIAEQLPKGLSTTVSGIVDTAVHARLTIGILGLVIALYSGVSWMGNLRAAIQAMWRPNFDTDNEVYDENLLKYYGKSLMYLLLLGAAVLVSIGLTVSASSAQSVVLTWLGADRVSWLGPVLRVVPILLAAAADVLIFGFLYQTLSPRNLKPAPCTADPRCGCRLGGFRDSEIRVHRVAAAGVDLHDRPTVRSGHRPAHLLQPGGHGRLVHRRLDRHRSRREIRPTSTPHPHQTGPPRPE